MPSANEKDQPVYFKQSDAQRIQAVVRAFESSPLGGGVSRVGRQLGLEVRLAVTSTSISARSGSPPTFTSGVGDAKFYQIAKGTGNFKERTPSQTVEILNPFAVTIASGKLVIVITIDLCWVIVAAECP